MENLKLYDVTRNRQFQDTFIRLYPELTKGELITKNITFVTTEACNLNCSYCVTGDTLITMSDFTKKRIDQVELGDKILAFNEKNDNIENDTYDEIKIAIVEQLHHSTSETIILVLEDYTELNITKTHKLLANHNKYEQYWKEAGDFKIGDYLYNIEDINKSALFNRKKIIDIKNNNMDIDVYNLGTSTRTYFANDIAVHNCYECHKTPTQMTVDTARKAIDALFDKEKMNGYITDAHQCAIIEFIGGEPFLNMDVVEFVSDYFLYKAYEMNHPWYKYHMFSVTSNGTLYHTKRVQDWISKYRERISISITIDGDKELHDSCRIFHDGTGSYDVVVEAIKDAIVKFNLTGTKVTFAPENITKINTAIPHLFELGLKEINANCVYENVWKDEHAPVFFRELIKLADYMIDTERYATGYCSIFDETIGQLIPPEENRNW